LKIKLGDLVVRKSEFNDLLFKVTGFDEKYAVLRGIRIPIITICPVENLIKINRERNRYSTSLRLVK